MAPILFARAGTSSRLLALTALIVCLLFAAGASSARADVVTFLPTGGEQTFTVPAGVTSIHMVAIGGRGGQGSPATGEHHGGFGGFGAIASADIAVTPGQVLYVEVAGNGASGSNGGAGGFNGGGAGGAAISSNGGGGGGASDVRLGPRSAGTSIFSRLIVAGGGGGGGGSDFGTPGSNEGGRGGSPATGGKGGGGAPGTTTEGGNGGCDEGDGGPGFGGAGGTYARCQYPGYGGGGGGGAGLFGGAGGVFSSSGEGGGAGSSGFVPGATNTSIGTDTTGAPAIAFTFTANALAPPAIAPVPASLVKCVVPKLGGRKLKGARRALRRAHCKLGEVHRIQLDAKHVVGQNPKPGKTRAAGSKVSVTLGA